MSDFDEIIGYCKKLSKAILKGDDAKVLSSDFINKKDQEEIISDLNDLKYWESRENVLKNINADDEWKKLEMKISIPHRIRRFYWKYAAAAVLIIGLGLGVLYNISYGSVTEQDKFTTPGIVAGSNRAILTLSDGQEIELAEEKSYATEDANLMNNRLVYTKKHAPDQLRYNYLTIPRGGKFHIQLSDGTNVWLNSETKIKYPVQFRPGQIRQIELVYGEAYFDVSHSTQHDGDSFLVKQDQQQIEVLGTEFNISAYKSKNFIYTTLVKGSIALSKGLNNKILRPGQQAVNPINAGDLTIKDVDVTYATSWKEGFFMFKDSPLQDMMEQLSRWYNVEVVFVNEEKKTIPFSGTLKRTDNIIKLLKSLEKTGEVQFNIQNKKIMIK